MPTLPSFRAPRRILQRMHSHLSATKSERYLEFHSQQVAAINQDLEEAAGKLKNVAFWTHIGKSDKQNRNIHAKFGRDGIHLSACGQYQFYKSLRGALASSANRLRNILSKTKGSETRTEDSKNFHEGGGQGRVMARFQFWLCLNNNKKLCNGGRLTTCGSRTCLFVVVVVAFYYGE